MPAKNENNPQPDDPGANPAVIPAPALEPQSDRKLDETESGGRFIVNGQTVDANGEPIK